MSSSPKIALSLVAGVVTTVDGKETGRQKLVQANCFEFPNDGGVGFGSKAVIGPFEVKGLDGEFMAKCHVWPYDPTRNGGTDIAF